MARHAEIPSLLGEPHIIPTELRVNEILNIIESGSQFGERSFGAKHKLAQFAQNVVIEVRGTRDLKNGLYMDLSQNRIPVNAPYTALLTIAALLQSEEASTQNRFTSFDLITRTKHAINNHIINARSGEYFSPLVVPVTQEVALAVEKDTCTNSYSLHMSCHRLRKRQIHEALIQKELPPGYISHALFDREIKYSIVSPRVIPINTNQHIGVFTKDPNTPIDISFSHDHTYRRARFSNLELYSSTNENNVYVRSLHIGKQDTVHRCLYIILQSPQLRPIYTAYIYDDETHAYIHSPEDPIQPAALVQAKFLDTSFRRVT